MHDRTDSSRSSAARVLAVGAEPATLASLRTWLPAPAQVEIAGDFLEAVGQLLGGRWDVVVAVVGEDAESELRLWFRALSQAPGHPPFIALARRRTDAADAALGAETLAEVEARYLTKVLAETGGRVGEAARILGIHRNTLARKVRALEARKKVGMKLVTRTETTTYK